MDRLGSGGLGSKQICKPGRGLAVCSLGERQALGAHEQGPMCEKVVY